MKVQTNSIYACSSIRCATAVRGYYVTRCAIESELFTPFGPWYENPGVIPRTGSVLFMGPDRWELFDLVGSGMGMCSKHPKFVNMPYRLHPRSTCLGPATSWRRYFPKGIMAADQMCYLRTLLAYKEIVASMWVKLVVTEITNPLYPRRLGRVRAPFGYAVYIPVFDMEKPEHLCLGEPELSELTMW